MPECRSCGAPITWARTKKDKTIPLDTNPVPGGNLVIVGRVKTEHGMAPLVAMADADNTDRDHYVAHFSTCPAAEKHRSAR